MYLDRDQLAITHCTLCKGLFLQDNLPLWYLTMVREQSHWHHLRFLQMSV